MRRILSVGALAAAIALPLAQPSLGGVTKSASVAIDFAVGADCNCYPVSTATWQG